MCIDKMRYIMIGCALALIALAGCKTPELSMDERISLPESGEMGMNDTTFVKPLSWDVFFQDTLLRGKLYPFFVYLRVQIKSEL